MSDQGRITIVLRPMSPEAAQQFAVQLAELVLTTLDVVNRAAGSPGWPIDESELDSVAGI